MPLVESHFRLPCVGIGAFGLFKLESISALPGKEYALVPSVK
jgi:hypothetical protein